MSDNLKSKTLSGLIWRYAERCGAQLIQFVVSIILARLLSREDFGLIGLITVFISIATVFAQSGLGQALVRKDKADSLDFSTVFYFSIVFSVLLYALLFFVAPYIAVFYKEPSLVDIIRVLGVLVIIGAVNSVQQAYIQRKMLFKNFFKATMVGTAISAVVGIAMAYAGFGIWALVAQQISKQIIDTVVLWTTVKWRPELVFSFKRMKDLFSYGWKLLCSSLIDTIYSNIYSLIIGQYYSKDDLGCYNRGKQFPMLIVNNINSAIDSVIFPVLSKVQNDAERFKAMMRRSIVTSTFFIMPAMGGLAAVAEPLTRILLTDKWLPAVPFIQFCCFIYAFWPIHTANLQAIKAMGRSDIFLKLEIIKKAVGVIILIITLPHGLTVMMLGRCIATLISSVVNAHPNKKLLGYSYFEQLKDIAPSMLLSLFMCGVVWSVTLLPLNMWIQITVQVVLGAFIYVAGAKLFKLECFEYVLGTVKEFMKKKVN